MCALPLVHVLEVMRPLPLEKVEPAPAFLLGLAVIRGEPLPVVDVAALLPGDDVSYGFDNIAGVQKMSPTLMERYLSAAQKVSRQALGTLQTAILTRLLRSSMIDVLSQDYMRTARAKGLLPATIIVIHALKNAMIPFVTMAAIQFGYMIGIQVTIEYIFAVPGMGSAVLNAVVNRDFPVIQGFTLVISAFFLFANIMADVFYALLDPRIRY